MPQLDTVYILTTYLWTWLILLMTTQKIKTFLMTATPTIKLMKSTTMTTQWL